MKHQANRPSAVLPLPASREELEKQERAARNQPNPFESRTAYYRQRSEAGSTPGAALAQHQLLTAISGLLGAARQFSFEE